MLDTILFWIESHPGLAAWVQALGSVGAILVAIWIGHLAHGRAVQMFEETRRREKDDRRRKAHSLAVALYPELLELKPVLQRVIIANAPMREPPLGIPPVLTESVDRLYLLGDAGDAIQQCLATARQLERMLQEVRGRPKSDDTIQAIRRQIEVSAGALDEALKWVEPIHDNPIDPET